MPSPITNKLDHVIVTGAAGFIGFHVSRMLLEAGTRVTGIDNLNDYYDPQLKRDRVKELEQYKGFRFLERDLADRGALDDLDAADAFIHLAAQAGVRYSLEHPNKYVDSNLVGFANVLEHCRHTKSPHLVFASSSSVYGANRSVPFRETDGVDHPISLYAATKKANEAMAHAYAHLYRFPVTGLRFFTVYGPWGRPDMAIFKFTKALYEGTSIDVYNHGDMSRDFTYVDDVARGVIETAKRPPAENPDWDALHPSPESSAAPYAIYNIGNHSPEPLLHLIELLEELTGKTVEKNMKPMQPGDVKSTFADVQRLSALTGFAPETPLETGLNAFVGWYKDYYNVA